MSVRTSVLVLTMLCCGAATAAAQTAADLVLVNGNVHTLDAANPRAQAVALGAGRILAVGPNSQIETFAGATTERIDLGGRTVLPGLIDAHIHVQGVGENLDKVRTNDLTSLDQLLVRVKAAAATAPQGA